MKELKEGACCENGNSEVFITYVYRERTSIFYGIYFVDLFSFNFQKNLLRDYFETPSW
jgi:hypothetical protein